MDSENHNSSSFGHFSSFLGQQDGHFGPTTCMKQALGVQDWSCIDHRTQNASSTVEADCSSVYKFQVLERMPLRVPPVGSLAILFVIWTSWFFTKAISQMKAKCPWLKCEALQSLMAFLLLINHWYLPIDPPTQGFWPWWHYSTTSALSHPPPLAKLLFDRWIDRWNHLPWSQGSGTGLKLDWSSDTKCKFNCQGRL